MKREAKLLLNKACDALILSIELFDRPHDQGRVSGALIQLNHGFEMLMKAVVCQVHLELHGVFTRRLPLSRLDGKENPVPR